MAFEQEELDPELIDILLQSLAGLSAIATMASTFLDFRDRRDRQRHEIDDSVRQQLRQLRRSLEDCVEAVNGTLRVLEQTVTNSEAVLAQQPRFGRGIRLADQPFHQVQRYLHEIDAAVLNVRQYARHVQSNLVAANLDRTANVTFDIDAFVGELNTILFQSPSFAEAFNRLRSLANRADDFINDFERALRRN
ncbi:hypothetical protein [Bradyrhizobium sp. BRP23]|uniref:hypothetical protein n=1 Tax=Bradyrhizobium sp. BRP23 TaxID=2793820 RepID=UPI001CD70EB3|nr:hypothetical protein [Bradyrhizobium sp. BRP23]MCA1418612.1 hypothetical protein [Bradyrhizobium sp. BRP23]